jgi:hypothetical protein
VALAVVGVAVWWWRQRSIETGIGTGIDTGVDTRVSTRPVDDPAPLATATWCEPVDGECPEGYPVKVARSGIFHEPGGRSYDRTVPERCYAAAAHAEADGYRRAKA